MEEIANLKKIMEQAAEQFLKTQIIRKDQKLTDGGKILDTQGYDFQKDLKKLQWLCTVNFYTQNQDHNLCGNLCCKTQYLVQNDLFKEMIVGV
ncbi:unnamed protein product [Paramecium sonneborni]|uniref:Uncharacterized protein n=1 Tax=Paramecium sonneborni TaxID=65129 RepID=A0A8S1MAA4_9CILI|nr:unnamed protein product [Paramecium sonneborni]